MTAHWGAQPRPNPPQPFTCPDSSFELDAVWRRNAPWGWCARVLGVRRLRVMSAQVLPLRVRPEPPAGGAVQAGGGAAGRHRHGRRRRHLHERRLPCGNGQVCTLKPRYQTLPPTRRPPCGDGQVCTLKPRYHTLNPKRRPPCDDGQVCPHPDLPRRTACSQIRNH